MCSQNAEWQKIFAQSIVHPDLLPADLRGNYAPAALAEVCRQYPMRINSYYLDLIGRYGEPLAKQAIPDPRELEDAVCLEDPLGEEDLSPVPNLIHKYPDRVLFLVHSQCAMYCRFCTRKRKVGQEKMLINKNTIEAGLEYIAAHPEIKDVLVSGGDPLLLSDEQLDYILGRLRAIPSVVIIRIGTRVPCVLPMRVTTQLTAMLKKYHPLYINTHFNHPAEITQESRTACCRLADAGIPLGCQTVLLKGVNDSATVLNDLFYGLLSMRVKPYYLFQGDMTKGTDHFRTRIEDGLSLLRKLIGQTSGMAVPKLALDLPGGGGKIPLAPNYLKKRGREVVFENYCGKVYTYSDG